MRYNGWSLIGIGSALLASSIMAATETSSSVDLVEVAAAGDKATVGTVVFEDSDFGLLVVPNLHGLEPGFHAAHIHANPSCALGADGALAGAAGDHFDPEGTAVHAGPYGAGHLGDLPNLTIEADGSGRIPVLAPRLTAEAVKGHALIIHSGTDYYDDHAGHQHGKGGARMYCGVIR